MKPRHMFIGLGIGGLVFILFILSIIAAKMVLNGRNIFSVGGAIGVLEVNGMITDSREFIQQLHDFRDDDGIKAIVLRIDSPGGVVGPSQEMYEEVRKLAQKKKIVVSMGSLAASGGYYIASPATKIYANPGTITGSIGVLMELSNMEGLLEKIGWNSFVLKSGKFKDSGSPFRPMTKEDRELFQGVIDNMHDQFIKAVAEGRNLPVEDVRKLADGRIYTGEQALKIHLVDRLGNMQDAIKEAARMAGIKGEPNVIYPPAKKMSLFDFIFQGFSDTVVNKLKSENGISARFEMK